MIASLYQQSHLWQKKKKNQQHKQATKIRQSICFSGLPSFLWALYFAAKAGNRGICAFIHMYALSWKTSKLTSVSHAAKLFWQKHKERTAEMRREWTEDGKGEAWGWTGKMREAGHGKGEGEASQGEAFEDGSRRCKMREVRRRVRCFGTTPAFWFVSMRLWCVPLSASVRIYYWTLRSSCCYFDSGVPLHPFHTSTHMWGVWVHKHSNAERQDNI